MTTLVDQTAAADQSRTMRAFVGFLASAVGTDQNYAGEDANPTNSNQQYNYIANPDGTYSVVGKPVSNVQSQAASASMSPVLLIGLAVGAFLLLK